MRSRRTTHPSPADPDLIEDEASAPTDDDGDAVAARLPRSERPSRTRLKLQSQELQQLGAEVAALPENRLADTPMPEGLREAILEYRRTRSHEGRRRQLQYIGKQMRHADDGPLREAVAAFKLGSARDTLRLHEAERWRDELITDDDALTRWAQAHPESDLQRLRSLVRAARRDAAAAPEQRHGRGYRELFQFIKPWLEDDE